jgi:hypothetical protein
MYKAGTLDQRIHAAGGEIKADPVHEGFVLLRVPENKPETMSSMQDDYELIGKVKQAGGYLQVAVPLEEIKQHLTFPDEEFQKSLPFEGVEILFSKGGDWYGSSAGGKGSADLGGGYSGRDVPPAQLDHGQLWHSPDVHSLGKAEIGNSGAAGFGGPNGFQVQAGNPKIQPGSGYAVGVDYATDYAADILKKEKAAYEKAKQLIQNQGVPESAFAPGGTFHGWSTNQLLAYLKVE